MPLRDGVHMGWTLVAQEWGAVGNFPECIMILVSWGGLFRVGYLWQNSLLLSGEKLQEGNKNLVLSMLGTRWHSRQGRPWWIARQSQTHAGQCQASKTSKVNGKRGASRLGQLGAESLKGRTRQAQQAPHCERFCNSWGYNCAYFPRTGLCPGSFGVAKPQHTT